MADETARSMQYEYKSNSSLVINPNKDLVQKRDRDEPTGEVLPLTTNELAIRMGDKYQRTKPKLLDDPLKAKKLKTKIDESGNGDSFDMKSGSSIKYDKLKAQSILSDDFEDLSSILYRPKTQETKQNYEIILSFIQESIGDQPRDILCGAADEVLITLKNDRLRDRERKREIESLLGSLNDERFALIVNLGKKITDWSNEQAANGNDRNTGGGGHEEEDEIDETIGVKVMIGDEEDDEDNDNDMYEINEDEGNEDEDDDNDQIDSTEKDGIIQGKTKLTKEDPSQKSKLNNKTSNSLQSHQIDAFWLQRKLSIVFNDPNQAQTKVKEVLDILKQGIDERDVENQVCLINHR
jgi:pre-mRNA-splicing helicase BRR2